MRYTYKDLQRDVMEVNEALKHKGANFHFRAQQRNGYTAIDLYDTPSGKCLRDVQGGSPLECKAALYESAFKGEV